MEAALKRARAGSDGGPTRRETLPEPVRALAEARTADAVFVVDPASRIAHWDRAAEALTGFLGEEVLGRGCHEVLRGEREGGGRLPARDGCPVQALVRSGQAVPSHDLKIETRVRGKRWVNVSVLAVDSPEGPYLVYLMRDAQRAHDTLQMARDLVELFTRQRSPETPSGREEVPALTGRQREVLGLLSAGRSAKEIGERLYLSEATVRNHIRAILQALGAHSQLEALARARELGLLDA